MTPTLHFPSEEALRLAITSALVPADVLMSPASGWKNREGALFVRPAKPLPREVLAALVTAGVRATEESPPGEPRNAGCWAELVLVRKDDAGEQGEGEVIFLLPDANTMLETAGELLRLGCDRQELRAVRGDGDSKEAFLLRVASPPYYTLARALDRVGNMRAFSPRPKGQDRVYTEVGYAHPFAGSLRSEGGGLLFLSPDQPWLTLPDGAWTDIYTHVDLTVPTKIRALTEPSELPRLSVTLRLSRGGRSDAPTLWVIRHDAVARVERLLASVPDDVAAGLLFAVGKGDPPVVILRARPGARKPVTLEIEGDGFRPHLQIANLFLPCDAILEPPLRRDKVRELIAPDSNFVTWLAQTGENGEFEVVRVPEASFRPLADWVEYVVDTSAPALMTWVRGSTFDFSSFEMEEPSPRGPIGPPTAPDVAPEAPAPRAPSVERAPKRAASKASTKTAREPARITVVTESIETPPQLEELAALETEFRELDVPADDPRRSALWRAMANLNHGLGRAKDAALCWTRALWDLEGDEAAAISLEWMDAEMGSRSIESLLAVASPSRDDVRAVASALLQESFRESMELDVNAAALWLDRHDDALDLRSLWLARASLSRLVGHDALGLARARDRLLVKLHRGMSVERDVPTFLRFSGGAGAAGHVEVLSSHLQALLAKYEKTKRTRSSVEADPKLTLAYVLFTFAYGTARLGRTDHARALAERATSMLDLNEPIHGFLARAYAARVSQALEGVPAETPLPPEVAARLNALDKLSRYKVDRVRQFSKVLEPHERLDPVVAFQRGEADPRGPEFANLRGMADDAAVQREVDLIFEQARKSEPDLRARLFDGVMDFFPMIPIERATRYLEDIVRSLDGIPPTRQAQLLEEAMMLAGHVGHQDLGRRVFQMLDPLIASLGAESAAEIAPVMGGMLRTLRRVGLRHEASQLLETMQKAAGGKGIPAMVARLHTAAGLAYLGHFDRGRAVFEEALGVLAGDLLVPARIDLTRALARAVGSAPQEFAVATLAKLADRLAVVTDSFNTNSHVCLSVVAFVESLVLGYASEELAIGERGRQWLDDDEYLIRRRIHKDMGPSR